MEKSLLRAESIARELGDGKRLALVMYGLATMRELLGQYEASEELLKAQLEIVDSGLTMEARELLACSTFHQGKFLETLDHAEKGLSAYDPARHHSPLMARYGENLGVSTNTWAALAHWFVGQADEALAKADLALEHATDQVYSVTTAQIQKSFLHQFRLEPEKCWHWANATKETATEHGFPFRIVQAEVLIQWSALELGHPDASVDRLEEAVRAYEQGGAALDSPYYAALVAEQYVKTGRYEDALLEIERAFDRLGPSGTFFYEPELLRLKGLARSGVGAEPAEVRDLLDEAVGSAQRYGALPLELRSTVEIMRVDSHSGATMAQRLRALIDSFSGTQESPDVTAANKVLAHLR